MIICHITTMIIWHRIMAVHCETKTRTLDCLPSKANKPEQRMDCTQRILALAYVHKAAFAERICFRSLDPDLST